MNVVNVANETACAFPMAEIQTPFPHPRGAAVRFYFCAMHLGSVLGGAMEDSLGASPKMPWKGPELSKMPGTWGSAGPCLNQVTKAE